jgi:hypothetical protein
MNELDSLSCLFTKSNILWCTTGEPNRIRVYRTVETCYNNITIEFVNPSIFVWSANDSEGNTFGVCHSFSEMAFKAIRWYEGAM